MIDTKLTEYYAKRAAEYERIYHKPERQADLEKLKAILTEKCAGLDLLEIACGTGFWTQFACRYAKSIVATDFNEEVLSIAREKNYGGCPVRFVKSDTFILDEVEGPFSGALIGFWWSHVPKPKLDVFLQTLHSKLLKGATVIIFDNLFVEGSSTPINRQDTEGNTYQLRELADGSIHEVLKNFPTKTEFTNRIAKFTGKFDFKELNYFWLAQYTLAEVAEK